MPKRSASQSGIVPWWERWLPEIYAVCALLVTLQLALLNPPLLVPDEGPHLLRAWQLANGTLVQRVTADGDNSTADSGLVRALRDMMPAASRQQESVAPQSVLLTHTELQAFAAERWTGFASLARFPNTRVYPPMLYLPQAAGLWVGRKAGATVLHSLWLARMLAALVAVLLGWTALRIARFGRPLLFAMLMLPTVLALNGSASQDAVAFGLAALAGAILTRAIAEERLQSMPELASTALLLWLIIGARSPYLPLLLFLVVPVINLRPFRWQHLRLPMIAGLMVIALLAVWQRQVHPLGVMISPVANPAAQTLFLRAHPLHALFVVTLGTSRILAGFAVWGLANFGLGAVLLPRLLYVPLVAAVLLLIFSPRSQSVRVPAGILGAATLLLVCLGMSLAEYVIWSAPGQDSVGGLQARYYLQLIPWLALVLPRWMQLPEHFLQRVIPVAMLLLVIIAFVTPTVIAERFYGAGAVTVMKVLTGL